MKLRPGPVATLLAALASGCATPPPPTAAARLLAQNRKATVEGRVIDTQGRPVPGVRVEGVPGGKDIVWSPAAVTDAEGRFRLSLDAPAEYVFLIFEGSVAAVTPSPKDPARVRIFLQAGETWRGIELTLLREERQKLIGGASSPP
ncbi:MAG: carboxypeptidase-like regulatory domain-containing protein [Thermoanaerobaculia bacterium]